jgi:hypothetical protein
MTEIEQQYVNGQAREDRMSEEEMRLRLDKLEAGHERITSDLSEVRVVLARNDGKLDTLLQLSEARRADEIAREKLLQEVRLATINTRPTMIKAIGAAVAAVLGAALYGILR